MTGETFAATLEDLRQDEGLRLTPYADSLGVLTIGYGINLDGGLSRAECELLLEHRAVERLGELTSVLPWFEGLDPELQQPMHSELIGHVQQHALTYLDGVLAVGAADTEPRRSARRDDAKGHGLMPPQGSKLGIVAVSGAAMLAILALLFVLAEIGAGLHEWMVSR